LHGKILIVTGSTGIGAAVARLASQAGARVLIATSDEESGIPLAAELSAELWTGDLVRPAAGESVLAQCLSRFGRVDALCNAAGLSGRRFGDGPIHECTDDGWQVTFAQNLDILFHMCRAVCARMLVQAPSAVGHRGAILNIGSVLAESPEPRHFATHAYAAAKGAVVALSRSMASYYAPHGIRVNVLAPGLVGTPMAERATAADLREFITKKQPLATGMVDLDDVAQSALFLLGDTSHSVTGQVLGVDAGWSVTGV
jgi:NAD(P)-dependent dehydrogenase (short-subunit alcohol dehydrogenase family)